MTPERTNKLLNVLNKRQASLTIVLENIEDPHNVSAVLRSCDAVGIQDVYVINNKEPRRKNWGYRSSSSAAKWLTTHQFGDTAECIATLKQKYKKIYTTHLASDSVGLYELDLTESVALVFGNEHFGVSEELLAVADGNFLIPQVGIIRSLNISVACAVTIYEAYRQRTAAGMYNTASLPEHRMAELKQEWGFLE
jgi:tRNA (guanosine-2'-O-)-methyltransferase